MKKIIPLFLVLILIALLIIIYLLYSFIHTPLLFGKSKTPETKTYKDYINSDTLRLSEAEDIKYADFEPPPFPESEENTYPSPTSEIKAQASVSGKVCYPAEGIPALDIYLQNVETKEFYQLSNKENQGAYIFANVQPGGYYAFAYAKAYEVGGVYSPAVSCGLTVSCTDHSPIKVVVAVGSEVKNIDICDWYGNEVPKKP